MIEIVRYGGHTSKTAGGQHTAHAWTILRETTTDERIEIHGQATHNSLDEAIRLARADCDRSIPAVRQGWRPT
jgi:hypothetical protein